MDALPHTADGDAYLVHKAQLNIADPTANATKYKATETIDNLRRNEIDPRHIIEKPGILVEGGKPGMSPRSKKNFIAMNKTNTTAYDNYQFHTKKYVKLNTKIVSTESYSPQR